MIKRTPLVLLLMLLLGYVVPVFAQNASIRVTVSGLEDGEGDLHLTLYNETEEFCNEEQGWRKITPIKGRSTMTVTFNDVKPGTYAIAGMHDENGDGEMEYNWIGMPTEGYCFSRDAKPVLSAPSFDETKFKVSGPTTSISIKMQN